MLDALPEEYDPIVAAMNSKEDLCLLDELESSLLAHESRIEKNRKAVLTESVTVNLTQASPPSAPPSTELSGVDLNPNFPTGTSHVTANSENHGYGSRGGRNGRGGGRSGRGGGRFGKVSCQICHKSGHDASVCYHIYSYSGAPSVPSPRAPFNPYMMAPRAPSYPPSFGYPAAPRPTPPRHPQPQAFLTGSDSGFSNQLWYPDSGASHHVTPDASNLSDASSLTGAEQVYMGNGQGLCINSVGSMNFPLSNHPNSSLMLHNLLLVPHITKNLMSVSKFAQDNRVFFKFHPQVFLVKSQDSSEVLLRGTVGADGLYNFINPALSLSKFHSYNSCNNLSSTCNSAASSNCISSCNPVSHINEITTGSSLQFSPTTHVSTVNISNSHSFVPCSTSISDSKYILWHTRLGHPHHQALAEVLKICNVPIPHKPPTASCSACCLGKSHRLPSSLSTTVYHHPFELVVCDLWGPSPIHSSGGYTYFLTCVDAFSRFVWVFPLRLKSDTLTQFIHFKTMVELQFNCKIKGVQSDGGGEFKPFTKYLTELGIVHRFTCPYTHHQNGIVERKHRHIVETGLALLAHSKLPLKYWDHAFVTAAYLINRMPSSSLQNQSPYSILMQKPPDYSSLRVFGCACFPFLRPYNSHKLAFRSQECIFLGYSSVHKGYKCLATDGNIYLSKDVLFHESRFPYLDLFHPSTSSTSSNMSWLPSAASPPIIPTHRVPPLQHISPTTSSLNRKFSSTSNHPSAAATAISSPSSPLPLSSQQNVSQSPSPSPNPAFSDLAEASTISPSSSSGFVNSDRSGSNSAANSNPVVSIVPSPHILNPLNVYPMTTRAKNGIVQPKIHPTLLLTHMEPTTVKQALASPH